MKFLVCFVILLVAFAPPGAKAQILPAGSVIDVPLGAQSTIIIGIELFWKFLNSKEKPFQERIKNVQEFFGKAETVVNKAVREMRMVKRIVELNKEIAELFERTVSSINQMGDEDGDGQNDLNFIDKWKHVQILLAISGEALSVFELFTNVVEADATAMGDKARVSYVQRVYKELLMIRASMRIQIRRINREIYKLRRSKRETEFFVKLFSPSG